MLSPSDPDQWRDRQRALNAERGDGGPAADPHRRRVTAELCRGADVDSPQRLTLLGLGRAGDVDLPELLTRFASVTAVDLDGEGLAEGLAEQGVAGDARVRAAGGVDLLPLPARDPRLPAVLADPPLPDDLRGAAEVAGSLCLLSQLVDRVAELVGRRHPGLPALAAAVRVGHLRRLADCLAPGGVGLLVTDLFSEATCPGLPSVSGDDAADLIAAELARGNVFHGVHPANVLRTLADDPELSPRVARSQCLKPWVWRPGRRAFAVTAVRFRLHG